LQGNENKYKKAKIRQTRQGQAKDKEHATWRDKTREDKVRQDKSKTKNQDQMKDKIRQRSRNAKIKECNIDWKTMDEGKTRQGKDETKARRERFNRY
jgi:hypothetical protein